jgi:tetratricopeptide (TPR) repeat protein
MWLWDAGSGELLRTCRYEHDVKELAFSPDGRRIATVWGNHAVSLWDVQTGELLPGLPDFPLSDSRTSPDGRLFAFLEGDVIRLLDSRLSTVDRARRERALRSDPAWHLEETTRYEKEGLWFASAFHYERLLSEQPGHAVALAGLFRVRLAAGQAEQFISLLERRTVVHPDNPRAWYQLAVTQAAVGQPEAYRRTIRRVLELARPEAALAGCVGLSVPVQPVPATMLGHLAYTDATVRALRGQVASLCVLRPDAVEDFVALLPRVPANDPSARGMVLCRAGRYAEAIQTLNTTQFGQRWPFLALAYLGQGKPDQARQELKKLSDWLAAPAPPIPGPKQTNAERLPWDEQLELDLLRREVEKALAAPPP